MPDNRDRLSEQIHLLGDVLGRTIVEQEGEPLYDLVEEVRGLAKAHRGGDEAAGERLLRRVEALPLAESRGVVKALHRGAAGWGAPYTIGKTSRVASVAEVVNGAAAANAQGRVLWKTQGGAVHMAADWTP